MPPAPLGARLCRMPALCLTGRNGVFCRAPGRRRALRLPHIPPKNGLVPLRQAAAQSMCAARRRPSLPAQTSLPHATARAAFPHDFPSANTPACILPPRSPAARSLRLPVFARLPGCASPALHAPRLVPPPFAFPSFPQLRASARHFPALRPGAPRASRPVFRPPATAQNLRPRDSFPVFTPRVALFLFLLAPSFTRPAKQTASRLSDSASGFPAARRPPSSGVST